MSIKITTLIENKKENYKFINEFGLSLLIEDGDKKIIFDTGKTGRFIKNSYILGINLEQVKDIVLSHNHYDHIGGIKKFTEKYNSKYNLHINKKFFIKKHIITSVIQRLLKNNFNEKFLLNKGVKIHFLEENKYQISENIMLFTNLKKLNNFETPKFNCIEKLYSSYILNEMENETVIGINTQKGLVLICGCSHIGIVNIIENIKQLTKKNIYGIIGGLHLKKASDKKIDIILKYFLENNIKFFRVSHCTGEKFVQRLSEITEDSLYNFTGNEIVLN